MDHKPSSETDITAEIDHPTWTAEIDDMMNDGDLSQRWLYFMTSCEW